jgi:glycerate 2-kinase
LSKILIATDSFKGSASSQIVGISIAKGWKRIRPRDEVVITPLTDGGEGSLECVELSKVDSKRVYLRTYQKTKLYFTGTSNPL